MMMMMIMTTMIMMMVLVLLVLVLVLLLLLLLSAGTIAFCGGVNVAAMMRWCVRLRSRIRRDGSSTRT
eukprot:COSAG01_NODE_2951_length_6804_cov_32.584489_9_plen_68_part_00